MITNVGIVGHEAQKFTPGGEAAARELIRLILDFPNRRLVSGGCHLGGIDIWAEEEADKLGVEKIIFKPRTLSWSGGYKERNIQIATTSDILHCIAVDRLAPGYHGMRFKSCYHCDSDSHVKGGGCWTMNRAEYLGKVVHLHIIENR